MEPATQAPRRRNVRGTKVPLRNGGWLQLLPRVDNTPYYEKLHALETALREQKGIPLDAELREHVSATEWSAVVSRAQIGTVVMAWGDLADDDDKDWPCRLPDGSLDEDAGVELLTAPGMTNEFLEAIEPIDDAFSRNRKIAEGNSSELSDGSSATESS
jgi:hypothetical protein